MIEDGLTGKLKRNSCLPSLALSVDTRRLLVESGSKYGVVTSRDAGGPPVSSVCMTFAVSISCHVCIGWSDEQLGVNRSMPWLVHACPSLKLDKRFQPVKEICSQYVVVCQPGARVREGADGIPGGIRQDTG